MSMNLGAIASSGSFVESYLRFLYTDIAGYFHWIILCVISLLVRRCIWCGYMDEHLGHNHCQSDRCIELSMRFPWFLYGDTSCECSFFSIICCIIAIARNETYKEYFCFGILLLLTIFYQSTNIFRLVNLAGQSSPHPHHKHMEFGGKKIGGNY